MEKNQEKHTKNSSNSVTDTKKDVRTKTVHIKHHHAKAYRKRHVASLVILLSAGTLLTGLAIGYNDKVNSGLKNARDFISSTFSAKEVINQTVESTYGYSLTYNSQKYYATGVDTTSGDLYIGNELQVSRAYELIRMAPTLSETSVESTNMTIRYYANAPETDDSNLAAIEQTAIKDITSKATLQAKKTGTSMVTYGGKQFLKTDWMFQSDNKIFAGLAPTFTTYTATVNKHPFVVEVLSNSLNGQENVGYEEVLQSFYFGTKKVGTAPTPSPVAVERNAESRSLLESALFGKLVSAAPGEAALTSENISSLYGPAVVKIFNVYCLDIYFDGKAALSNVCNGGTGSGFFINQDGHIASNGHVVNADPKDILIQYAYSMYRKGDTRLLDFLGTQAKLTATEIPSGTLQERLDYVFNRLYDVDENRISTQNSTTNLLVALGKELPDVKELVSVTSKRQSFNELSTVKKAEVVQQDFRSIDGFTKYYASDVAIIKIDGANYPVTKLGSLTTLLQGANLNILGFPGNASDNGIVDAGESTVTLTSGKVSAIKNALGSDKKLVETDTTIGHGNSGGPAFNDSGDVIGISTYTATKVGDGTYNYVRDVKDLIDLAKDASVTISDKSLTQQEWQKALDYFNEARYSKSLVSFANVEKLYPSHPRVTEFVAAAKENIAAGKDVKDFPIVLVAVGAFVLLAGAVVATVFIIRHKKAHNVYKTHVTTGMMQPLQQGGPTQVVAYDPAHIAAQKNVYTAGQPAQYVQQPMTVQPAAMPATVQPPVAQQMPVVAPTTGSQPQTVPTVDTQPPQQPPSA